jgi:hypothetical protein
MLNNIHFRALIENGQITSHEFWNIYEYQDAITRGPGGENVFARIASSIDAGEVAVLAKNVNSEATQIVEKRADRWLSDFG